MAKGVLIDTSAWIDALRTDGDPEVRERVREALLGGDAYFCDMVRLELWIGARGPDERRMLRELEEELVTVPTTDPVWAGAARMARACRKRGITVPATDLLVAACADQHRLGLLHHDAHFDQIAKALRPPEQNEGEGRRL